MAFVLVALGALLLGTGLALARRTSNSWLAAAWRSSALFGTPASLGLVGAAAAALVHSSSAISVLALALVDSGSLSMAQGLALVLGANVGTTFTAQAVSLLPGLYVTPALLGLALAAGGFPAGRGAATLLLSMAGVVEGVDLLSQGLLRWLSPAVHGWVPRVSASAGTPVAFLLGWAITALVQSSTVVSSVTVGLARAGLVPAATGAALVLGANVGTVTTDLVASAFLGSRARRLAVVDLLTNLGPALLFVSFLDGFVAGLSYLDSRPERVVANAHTLFNLCTGAIFFPWVGRLARWIER